MNTQTNRNTEIHQHIERGGSAPSPRVEQWRFPLGSHEATLQVYSPTGEELTEADMDALHEITNLFKRQVARRSARGISVGWGGEEKG